MFKRRSIAGLLTSVLVSLGASSAISQESKFPSHAIHIIVPFAPGGGVDTLARLIAERIQTKSGVTVSRKSSRRECNARRDLCSARPSRRLYGFVFVEYAHDG